MKRVAGIVFPLLLALASLPMRADLDAIQKKLAPLQTPQADLQNPVQSEYVVFDRWPDHSPRTIFVKLYVDDVRSAEVVAFRVRRDGSLKRLVSNGSPDTRGLELRDMTADGIPELLVSSSPGNRATGVEIYGWNGRAFVDLGGTTESATHVDLDHDGIPELITHGCCAANECGTVIAAPYLSRFQHGRFDDDTPDTLVEVIVMTKRDRGPETIDALAVLPDKFSRECHAHIVNGTRGGKHRAAGLELQLDIANGPETGRPPAHVKTKLTAKTEYLDVPLPFPSRCSNIELTMTGPVGATVAIVIETDTLD
jgi:hypothetical protein